MNPATFFAWALALCAGFSLWLALSPGRKSGWVATAVGYGCVLGMLLAAAATALAARADTLHALRHAAPWLVAMTAVAGMIAWRKARSAPARSTHKVEKANKWTLLFLVTLLVSSLWRGWIALREILLRPTYPWDAWDAWAVKSKTWALLGHYVPFVSISEWMRRPYEEVYTSVAWGYPATLAWMQVWFAAAIGGWVEPLLNLPWFALWIGLLFGHYGQWRALGIGRTQALAGTYALASLPLLDVHVALAGYADLWVATLFGFAILAWLRWLRDSDRGQLAIAVVCAGMLPLLKLEGAVWLLLFAMVVAYGAVPRRWRHRALIASVIVIALLVAVFGLKLPVPGLGWVAIAQNHLVVPVIGHVVIAWHGAAFASILNSLFVQPNWHLLWWLTPVIIVWRWRALRAEQSTRQLASLLLACVAFLLFLFVFTDAASWAESYTAINRLLMHIVPMLVTLLMLLLRDVNWGREFRRTTPSPAARSAQA